MNEKLGKWAKRCVNNHELNKNEMKVRMEKNRPLPIAFPDQLNQI